MKRRIAWMMIAAGLMAAPACDGRNSLVDFDGDGVLDEDDCAPDDPSVYPGAEDVCGDGVDSDCDGADCPDDHDHDGISIDDGDCDDNDPDVHPGAADPYGDGVDSDCDGADGVDGDGDGYAANADGADHDCDDGDPEVNPGVAEVCGNQIDDDCDGTANDCGFSGAMSLDQADAILQGEEEWNLAGWGLVGSGDLTGDGVRDIVVGAPGWGSGGRVYVVGGWVHGLVDLSAADAFLDGGTVGAWTGRTVADAGDLDGDGATDLLVGAPAWDDGVGMYVGVVYVVSGPVAPVTDLTTDYTARLSGAEPWDEVGGAVAGAGDVDGDGNGDLLVAAPGAEDNDGRLYLLYGPVSGDHLVQEMADAWFLGDCGGSRLGESLAVDGTPSGTGAVDLAVGVPYHDGLGSVELLSLPLYGEVLLDDAATTARLEGGGRMVGWESAWGDLDGDGTSDLVIASWTLDLIPQAHVVYGPMAGSIDLQTAADAVLSTGEAIDETDPDQFVDGSVAVVGDVDGDGREDILLGAPMDPVGGRAGAAFLHTGAPSGAVDLAAGVRFDGTMPQAETGLTVAGAGDLDGDGLDDMLIGAPAHDETGEHAGAVYVVLGRAGL